MALIYSSFDSFSAYTLNDNLSSPTSQEGSRAETISAKLTLTNYTFGSLMEFWKHRGNRLFNYRPRLTLRPQNYCQEG